jgi:hypothetical protein
MKTALILLLTILLPAAVSIRAQQPQTALPSACGPADAKFWSKAGERSQKSESKQDAGKARIYFVHQLGNGNGPWTGTGQPTFPIGLDGNWVGAVHDSSFFFVDVAPGEHHVCVLEQTYRRTGGDSLELMPLRVEAGNSYFVLTRMEITGSNMGNFSLSEANRDMGQFLIDTLPISNWRRKN